MRPAAVSGPGGAVPKPKVAGGPEEGLGPEAPGEVRRREEPG